MPPYEIHLKNKSSDKFFRIIYEMLVLICIDPNENHLSQTISHDNDIFTDRMHICVYIN